MRHFHLVILGFAITLLTSACGQQREYYAGRDAGVAKAVLGIAVPPESVAHVWVQTLSFPGEQMLSALVKIKISQEGADAYCAQLGLSKVDVSKVNIDILPLETRDARDVAQWWSPPSLLNKSGAAYHRDDSSGSDLRARWLDGYLYIYKKTEN